MILNVAFRNSVCCEGDQVGMNVSDRFGAELLTIFDFVLAMLCFAINLLKPSGFFTYLQV